MSKFDLYGGLFFRSSVVQLEAVATWWMDISDVTAHRRRWRLLGMMNIGCKLNGLIFFWQMQETFAYLEIKQFE